MDIRDVQKQFIFIGPIGTAMRKHLILLVLALIFGCSSEELPAIKQLMEIQLNDQTFTFAEDESFANENCENIFLNTSYFIVDSSRVRLEIAITTDGRIKEITYLDFSDVIGRQFKTADYLSSEVFFIENYAFSPLDRTLSFEFDGTLYEIDESQNTKSIAGKVKIENLKSIDCTASQREINAHINQEAFNVVDIIGFTSQTRNNQNSITSFKSVWNGISDDGFSIAIVTSDELKDMDVGVYSFNENDSIDLVTVRKYEGAYEAIVLKERNGEWKDFQYDGEFVIEEQVVDFSSITRGRFSLKAYQNGEVIYSITDGTFSI
ncbi:MAG: hypothetical protein AAGI25_00400 [Bacteroidota bacterium]